MQITIDLEQFDYAMVNKLYRMKTALAEQPMVINPNLVVADAGQQDYKQVADFAKEVEAEAVEDAPADLEAVREAMRNVSSTIGTGTVIEIVKRHGAPSASKLDPKHYAAVIADLNAALAKH